MELFGAIFLMLITIIIIIVINSALNKSKKRKVLEEQLASDEAFLNNKFNQFVLHANELLKESYAAKTITSKQYRCERAIQEMENALSICKNENIINTIQECKALYKVIPVFDFIEKADKLVFKKQNKKALDKYLDAIYEIKTSNITNDDFILSKNEEMSVEQIKAKAKELGWEENQNETS